MFLVISSVMEHRSRRKEIKTKKTKKQKQNVANERQIECLNDAPMQRCYRGKNQWQIKPGGHVKKNKNNSFIYRGEYIA